MIQIAKALSTVPRICLGFEIRGRKKTLKMDQLHHSFVRPHSPRSG